MLPFLIAIRSVPFRCRSPTLLVARIDEWSQWRPASRSQPTRARPRLLPRGGRWLALPHPRLLSKSWSRWHATFCAWGRQAPMARFGRLADLAKVEAHKSDMKDRCFGELPRRVHGSGQPKQLSTGASAPPLLACAGASSAAGGCAPICRPRHVRRAARDSGCTRVGAVPEVGSFNAITRESKVWASGLTPRRLATFSGLPARP